MQKAKVLIVTTVLGREGLPWINQQLDIVNQKRAEQGKGIFETKRTTLRALNYNTLEDASFIIIAGLFTTPAEEIIRNLFLARANNSNGYLEDNQTASINSRLIVCHKTSEIDKKPRNDGEDYRIDGIAHFFYPHPSEGELFVNLLVPHDAERDHGHTTILNAL